MLKKLQTEIHVHVFLSLQYRLFQPLANLISLQCNGQSGVSTVCHSKFNNLFSQLSGNAFHKTGKMFSLRCHPPYKVSDFTEHSHMSDSIMLIPWHPLISSLRNCMTDGCIIFDHCMGNKKLCVYMYFPHKVQS